ncbi:MAG: glutaminase [Microbacterium sp.]
MTLSALLDSARLRLQGAPREALGAIVEPRRILGIARAPRVSRVGDAWHVGVLLISDDGVHAVGDVVRSREGVPRGFTAESQRQRAELAAAAFRGGFAEGETVHIGWRRLDADAVDAGAASGPLALVDGVPSVRWSAAGGWMPLAAYLDERIALLISPPGGA